MRQPLRRDLLQAGTLLPLLAALPPSLAAPNDAAPAKVQSWKLASRRTLGIHDVSPAPDAGVWFTAQATGHLGWFEPGTGRTDLIGLGSGASPHGVIQGPDKAAWITDSGQNAIGAATAGPQGRGLGAGERHRLHHGDPFQSFPLPRESANAIPARPRQRRVAATADCVSAGDGCGAGDAAYVWEASHFRRSPCDEP